MLIIENHLLICVRVSLCEFEYKCVCACDPQYCHIERIALCMPGKHSRTGLHPLPSDSHLLWRKSLKGCAMGLRSTLRTTCSESVVHSQSSVQLGERAETQIRLGKDGSCLSAWVAAA